MFLLMVSVVYGCQQAAPTDGESDLYNKISEWQSEDSYSDSLIGSGSWAVFPPNVNADSLLAVIEEIHKNHNIVSKSIVGTWIAEKDSKSKWVFTSDLKCKRYYDSVLLSTYTYSISNTSPQCGETVPVEQHTSYLKLTKEGPVNSKRCYEINGITAEKLSLRVVDRGGLLLFDRQ